MWWLRNSASCGFGQRKRVGAVQPHAAAAGRIERADDEQQRALARAAGAEDRRVLPGRQRQRRVAQHDQRLAARGKRFADVLDDEIRHMVHASMIEVSSTQRSQTVKSVFHIVGRIPFGPAKAALLERQRLGEPPDAARSICVRAAQVLQRQQARERAEQVGDRNPRVGPQSAFVGLHLGQKVDRVQSRVFVECAENPQAPRSPPPWDSCPARLLARISRKPPSSQCCD